MQVEKAPTESYADVGGLEQQIQEIKEAVELPLTHPELYEDIGIKPPKARAQGLGRAWRVYSWVYVAMLVMHAGLHRASAASRPRFLPAGGSIESVNQVLPT